MGTKVYIHGNPKFMKTIADLKPKEFGWCVPWALNPETNEINETFSIEDIPGGTVEMKVWRDIEGDLHADISKIKFEYSRKSK